MRQEPATGSTGNRAPPSDEVSNNEVPLSPSSGGPPHLCHTGQPGQGRLHAPLGSSTSSLGPGISSIPQGSGPQYCPGGPTMQATNVHRAPAAHQIGLTTPPRSCPPQAEARHPSSRASHSRGGHQCGSHATISTTPLAPPEASSSSQATRCLRAPDQRRHSVTPARISASSRVLPTAA
ncbi:hypothetical protein NDU88_005598 [Pleurodeles waltl]|uniref:Uncharacterized protein n=1 Tax=Pleurodeles waltl TaxID=8319 RepID=A0AAV7UJR0_PLEWA|nr:hypothetical protein NDU88_005598 [Pleurodeles waltl]